MSICHQNIFCAVILKKIKENIGLLGGRFSTKKFFGLPIGLSFVLDRNQYLGLKDGDGDGRPNIVDDFPDNSDWFYIVLKLIQN